MNITQFRYSADNFSYLVYGPKTAIAIDPGAVDDILDYVSEHDLILHYVTNTHSHPDHTSGNSGILQKSSARFLNFTTLSSSESIELDGEVLKVYHTPGHMADCITFHHGPFLITGDTLFNGTIGNCFSGDMNAFFQSIRFLAGFDKNTRVYAGHDYVEEAMTYARIMDPDNPDIDPYLASINPADLYTTVGDELKVNPYLRYNVPYLVDKLKQSGLNVDTEFDRFNSMYEFG